MPDFEEQPVVPASCWKRPHTVYGSGVMQTKDVFDRFDLFGQCYDIACEFLHQFSQQAAYKVRALGVI